MPAAQTKETKMRNIQETLKGTGRDATVAATRPARVLNEDELDRVTGGGGKKGGVADGNI
jgi:hypothetical protein